MTKTERALRECIAEAWASGGSPSQQALAEAMVRKGEAISQPTVGNRFREWAAAGVSESQVGAAGNINVAYIFNWTSRPVEDFSLRDLVEPILVEERDGELVARQEERAKKLRSALRLYFGIEASGSDGELLGACEAVNAHEVYDLPKRIYDRALETVGKRTAANYRSRIRAVMRDAGGKGRVPIVFPRVWEDDAWSAARDRYFGSAIGNLTANQRSLRCYWNRYAEAAKALNPAPEGPEAVTIAQVEEIGDGWAAKGEGYRRDQVKTMLRTVAREFGEGPYAGTVSDTGTAEYTRNGWRNPGRLLSADGDAKTGDWGGFLELVSEAGYEGEWVDVLGWYGEFISLTENEVEAQADRFPTRPPRWYNSPSSVVKRIINLRTILGLAPEILGRAPAELTPYDVLGVHHRRMIAGLREWWAARARDPMDKVSTANSDGLEKLILTYGLVAYALVLRSQHDRNAAPASAEDHRLMSQVGVQRTVAEARLGEAYRASRAAAKAIEKARKAGSSASGDNTVKDILRIVRNTPASYWIALLDEMIREVHAQTTFDGDMAVGIRDGISERAYHCLVADTYYHGWLVSTGMRISETAHIRLDIQYTVERRRREVREAHLRASDRKETANTLPHDCAIRDRFVPRWLEALYLERTRPFFMVTWPQTTRILKNGRVLKAEGEVQDHEWLFVDRKGRPIGCAEETEDGSERKALALNARLSHLRKRWQSRSAKTAVRLGLMVSTHDREYANHAVRNAMGFAIYQRYGLQSAANYLGDKEGSIEGVYTAVRGELVDTSGLGDKAERLDESFQAAPDAPRKAAPKAKGTPKAAAPPSGVGVKEKVLRERIDRLTDQLIAGEIAESEFAATVAKLERALAA